MTQQIVTKKQSVGASVDNNATSFLLGTMKACVMLAFFANVISVIYLQQQPYRYTKSHAALEKFLDMPVVQSLQGVEEIREWYEDLTMRIPRTAMRDINANCGYNKFAQQNVNIDSSSHVLHDPRTQYQSCGDSTQFVGGHSRGLYISGNLQIMGVGIFSARSRARVPSYVDDNGIAVDAVMGNVPRVLSARKDAKVIEICRAPWGEMCLYADGLKGEWGSTLRWEGLHDHGVAAYALNSSASVISGKPAEMSTLRPCFVYDTDGSGITEVRPYDSSYSVKETREGVTNCAKWWTVPARVVRNTCQEDLLMPSAFMSFRAAKEGQASVLDLYNTTFLCSVLFEHNAVELQSVYFVSSFPLSERLTEGIPYYGAVVKAPNEHMFATLLWDHVTKLNFLRAFDEHSRMIRIFMILRNYGTQEMFYALVSLTFFVDSSGYTTSKLVVSFVPMIKYFYALDDSPWMFKEVVVLEIFLGIFGVGFVCKTLLNVWQFVIAYCGLKRGRLVRWRMRKIFEEKEQGLEQLWKKNVEVVPVPTCDLDLPGNTSSLGVAPTESHPISANDGGEDGNGESQRTRKARQSDGGKETKVDDHPDLCTPKPFVMLGAEDSADVGACKKESEVIIPRTIGVDRDTRAEQSTSKVAPSDSKSHVLASIGNTGQVRTDRSSFLCLMLDVATSIVLILFLVSRVNFVKACLRIQDIFSEGSPVKFNDVEVAQNDISDAITDVTSVAYTFILVVVCQFFRYMSFDPRMGIVISTIHDSIEFLGPILLIFIGVLIAFAALGSQMFGAFHFGWSTIGRSILSLMMMILGDHDQFYSGMICMPTIKVAAAVFFWGFIVLLFFVTFNMVLAVVLTIYDEKHTAIKDMNKKKVD